MKKKFRTYTGTTSHKITEREINNRGLSWKAATEGIVLLENKDDLLPLKTEMRIGLYGAGGRWTLKGGTGSGDVNERYSVSAYDGLSMAGYVIVSENWLNEYDVLCNQARLQWKKKILDMHNQSGEHFFVTYSKYPFLFPELPLIDLEAAQNDGADTAIFVLSRIAGENADVRDVPGAYYLSANEKLLLMQLSKAYEHIVLIINSGNLIDLNFVKEYPKIHAIIHMSQAGQEGGRALADIISGELSPSGKLADTWAINYSDYPNADIFSYKNGDVRKEMYEEGIYVGYRYFDTFEVPVKYSFGYGLSYTAFDYAVNAIELDENNCAEVKVKIQVLVTNKGTRYSGKEILQVYVSCPQGKVRKEFRRLVAFGKTEELDPGQCQKMTLEFSIDQLSSYDDSLSAWILESGDYGIWIGNSLENSKVAGMLWLLDDYMLKKCESVCTLKENLEEIQPEILSLRKRELTWKKDIYEYHLPIIQLSSANLINARCDYSQIDLISRDIKQLVDSLSEAQLIALVTGDPGKGQGSMLGTSGITVPGSAGETSDIAKEEPFNIASIVLADGPAGLRLNPSYQVINGRIIMQKMQDAIENGFFSEDNKTEGITYYQYCTAIPVGSLLAQSWNLDLLREVGTMIGQEMQLFNVSLWLAPGMNIHRNPLCGRNFEYYSEDPYLTGKVAAAITLGVQSNPGCGTTIKHFACNNQEDNRMGSDSIVSARALREIYLKGFEIAVRESQPMAIMTSYNMINGVHAANSYDLCTKIARNEWGFRGLIMTDWTTTNATTVGECTATGCILAGNDLIMPGMPEDRENLKKSLDEGRLSTEELKTCVCRVVKCVLCSNQYENAVSYYQVLLEK